MAAIAQFKLVARESIVMEYNDFVLTDRQKMLLEELAPVMTVNRFYLAGGTAVALHLGHRRSMDFDWFTTHPIPDALQLAKIIQESEIPLSIHSVEKGTLHGEVRGLRVTFLEYRYPNLNRPLKLNQPEYDLASLDDLCCMKLSAIAQRGSCRDFIDIYALLNGYKTLDEMISLYQKKYQTTDIGHLLYALVYFTDAESEPMPVLLQDIDWQIVKNTIQQQVKRIAK